MLATPFRVLCAPLIAPLLVLHPPAAAGPARAPAAVVRPQEPAVAQPPSLTVRDWLAIGPLDGRGRRPFRPDAVFARYLLDRDAAPPQEGDTLSGELGREAAWEARAADEQGSLGGRLSWGYAALELDAGGVWMANLQGAHTLFVNGEGFAGDYYGYGKRGVPVELRAGTNHLFVTGTRGAPRLSFWKPPKELFVAGWDTVKPDLVTGQPADAPLTALVVNASSAPREELLVVVEKAGAGERSAALFPFGLPPLGIAKPPLQVSDAGRDEPLALRIDVDDRRDSPLLADSELTHALDLTLERRAPDELRIVTFRSGIDDSVQEYAVRPALKSADEVGELGLVLTLHGAGVYCRNQAASYPSHDDLWIVAPTNRRPFGFDWQDWGRSDAYEVLEHALMLSGASGDRIYLTGHSMGGHGVWHLAANDPDRWAAIAPSAGWESFDSYGPGRPDGELADVWQDADAASRTLELVQNLVPLPTFVLHGEKDDNVPADQARTMLAALEAAGGRPEFHLQPGAGHWWDGDAPGADCVSWPAIFELFAESRRASDPEEIDFVTVDPEVDSGHHWVRVLKPVDYGGAVHVRGHRDEASATVRVETQNARSLWIYPPESWSVERIVLDGYHFAWEPESGDLFHCSFVRDEGAWRRGDFADAAGRNSVFSGPFKRAFGQGFVLVYGTAGSEPETAELLARARFDAETWWYRAKGHTWVLRDEVYLKARERGEIERRNVILYGNEDTNRAWSAVLREDCPVRASRGAISVGERTWEGGDLACLFVYPQQGKAALVGVFADSGPAGTRLGYTFQTFVSGAGFPDLALVGSRVLVEGDGGVLCAGWFDGDWRWRRGRVER